MTDATAVNDVIEMIKNYQQSPEEWINLRDFYDEARREIEGRVEQHLYFSVDGDEALKKLDNFYSNQLSTKNKNNEITDGDER